MDNLIIFVGQNADWVYLFIAFFSALSLLAFVFCEIKKQAVFQKPKKRRGKKSSAKKRLRRWKKIRSALSEEHHIFGQVFKLAKAGLRKITHK